MIFWMSRKLQHWNLLRAKIGAKVVIRATTLFNLQCNNVTRQFGWKCCLYHLTVKLTCTWSAGQASLPFTVFFSKSNKRTMEATSSQTQSAVFKTPSSHLGMNIYRALSFDRINVFNMAHLHFDFTFNTELSIESIRNVCYCFREPIKTFIFWCLSNRLFCTCFRSPK